MQASDVKGEGVRDFDYLIEKIRETDFCDVPFEHIIIEEFFTQEHFDKIVNSTQIKAQQFTSNEEVVNGLMELGYRPEIFPGCITDVNEYIEFADGKKDFKRNLIKGYGKDVIEGYGLTMRLKEIRDPFLSDLINFLNSDDFLNALKEKMGVVDTVDIETAYQKNLTHYEISPHCDTSRKALTYMINIYNVDDCSHREMHTHLCRFKPEYRYLYEVWKNNEFDPVWVPWDWCETVKKTNTNNSISIFKPSYDTLHAVKVTEEHFTHQRNQIYGNLWYNEPTKSKNKDWRALDLVGDGGATTRLGKIKFHLKQAAKTLVG